MRSDTGKPRLGRKRKTPLGEYLTELRIEHEETLESLSKSLEISRATISAVTRGTLNMTDKLYFKLVNHYALSDEDAVKLKRLKYKSTVYTYSGRVKPREKRDTQHNK